MKIIKLPPDESSYSVDQYGKSIRTQAQSNIGRIRKNLRNNNIIVVAKWIALTKTEYTYLYKSYLTFCALGGVPFAMQLQFDHNVAEYYKTMFVTGSFVLTAVQGEAYFVDAKLDAKLANVNKIEPFDYVA
jgi:hypothetical protein